MRLEEVLPALREGKKIRRHGWFKEEFIVVGRAPYEEGECVLNMWVAEDDASEHMAYPLINTSDLIKEDWEVIE